MTGDHRVVHSCTACSFRKSLSYKQSMLILSLEFVSVQPRGLVHVFNLGQSQNHGVPRCEP